MTRPVFLITLGAIAGAVAGVVPGGGGLGRQVVETAYDKVAALVSMAQAPERQAARPAPPPDASHFVFSACLRKGGDNVEQTLRDLLEFHEHDATLSLVSCLLDGDPRRFCEPRGRKQAYDAMEIYLWSRDDAHRTSPAHGLADKIRMLDRTATQPADIAPDPFVVTWSGPGDRAIFDKLKSLVKGGYLDPGAFSYSGRAELREALRGVKPDVSPCSPLAQGG
jgi:hypothetical protein